MLRRLAIVLFILVALVSIFIAPPYRYRPEEEARLKDDFTTTNLFAGPIRAWQNWRACGTVSSCEVLRCAALEGGCIPPPRPYPFNLEPPKRFVGETDQVFRAEMAKWCAATRSAYEQWAEYLKSGERCLLSNSIADKPAPGSGNSSGIQLRPPKFDCHPVTADTQVAGPASPTANALISSYERNCR